LQAFVAQIDRDLVLAQALIRRVEPGYELRHVADRGSAANALRELRLTDLRALAQFTASGAFRPLKAAPSLPAGWWLRVKDDAELDAALNQLYPGTIADWFAAQSPSPPLRTTANSAIVRRECIASQRCSTTRKRRRLLAPAATRIGVSNAESGPLTIWRLKRSKRKV